MTITDNGRLSPEEMDRARELFAQGVRSKNGIKTGLKVGWVKAEEALARLSQEEADRERLQTEQRRARLAKLKPRKTRASRLPVRSGSLPQAPVSPVSFPAPVPASPAPVEVFSGPPAPLPVPWFAPAAVAAPEPVAPVVETVPEEVPAEAPQVSSPSSDKPVRPIVTWPVLLVAVGAFVAIWAGWVALGKLTGFGKINLLPGFWSGWTVDTAITLPLGMEAYAAYAFYVWLHPLAPRRARRFAMWTSLSAAALGMGGQTALHLMTAAKMTAAPWQITTVVSCLPVAVFCLAAALAHLVRAGDNDKEI